MKRLILKPRFLRHPKPPQIKYPYGLVMNNFGTANKLRCLASALRSCDEVHCNDDHLNTLLQSPLPSSCPAYDYQQFSTWRLVSPFWNPGNFKKGYRGSLFLEGCRDKEIKIQRDAVDLEYFNIPKKPRRDISKTFKSIKFSNSIIGSAAQIRDFFDGEPYVGVAIRTWVDCNERRHLFDLATFEKQLSRLHPDCNIFLTSDSPDLETYLIANCKCRIMTSSKYCEDDAHIAPARSIKSHQRALREILILASADLLIGSYMSTFVEVAWWLSGGNKPIQII